MVFFGKSIINVTQWQNLGPLIFGHLILTMLILIMAVAPRTLTIVTQGSLRNGFKHRFRAFGPPEEAAAQLRDLPDPHRGLPDPRVVGQHVKTQHRRNLRVFSQPWIYSCWKCLRAEILNLSSMNTNGSTNRIWEPWKCCWRKFLNNRLNRYH